MKVQLPVAHPCSTFEIFYETQWPRYLFKATKCKTIIIKSKIVAHPRLKRPSAEKKRDYSSFIFAQVATKILKLPAGRNGNESASLIFPCQYRASNDNKENNNKMWKPIPTIF